MIGTYKKMPIGQLKSVYHSLKMLNQNKQLYLPRVSLIDTNGIYNGLLKNLITFQVSEDTSFPIGFRCKLHLLINQNQIKMRRRFVLQKNTSSCIVVQGDVIVSRESKESTDMHIRRIQASKPKMLRNLEAQLKEYRDSKR